MDCIAPCVDSFQTASSRGYTATFFLFMGISTTTGGCAHLFGYYLPNYLLHSAAWSLSAAGVYALQRGSVYDYPDKIRNILNKVFLLQLVLSVAIYFGYQLYNNFPIDNSQVGTPGFQAVMVSTAIGFIGFILPLHLIKLVKEKDNGAAIFLMGMVISLAAPLIQGKGWGISAWFNHNDVAHIILAVCYYIYYLSIRLKVQQYNAATEGA